MRDAHTAVALAQARVADLHIVAVDDTRRPRHRIRPMLLRRRGEINRVEDPRVAGPTRLPCRAQDRRLVRAITWWQGLALALIVALAVLAFFTLLLAATSMASDTPSAGSSRSTEDKALSELAAHAASRYRRVLARIGAEPTAPPRTRQRLRLTVRWLALRDASRRHLSSVRAMRPTTPAGKAQRACLLPAFESVLQGATAGHTAYRMLARHRLSAYRRQLKRARQAQVGASNLVNCVGAGPAPAPPPAAAPPPSAPAPAGPPVTDPTVTVSRFEAHVDVVGPFFPFSAVPGGVIAGCGAPANDLYVWFEATEVDLSDLRFTWTLPSGLLVLSGVGGTNAATGESVSIIRKRDDGPMPPGLYAVTSEASGATLATASVTLAC